MAIRLSKADHYKIPVTASFGNSGFQWQPRQVNIDDHRLGDVDSDYFFFLNFSALPVIY